MHGKVLGNQNLAGAIAVGVITRVAISALGILSVIKKDDALIGDHCRRPAFREVAVKEMRPWLDDLP